MGLLDLFQKPKARRAGRVTVTPGLPSISYAVAYVVLPRGAFHDCERFVAMWTDATAPAGPLFYRMGCQFHKTTPVMEHAALFRAGHGQLDAEIDYYLLQYPSPPTLDFLKVVPGKNIADVEVPVLAPWFSAMLRHRESNAVAYYVLGQSPVGGGATLRSLTREGVNRNLGPGPEPRLEEFLKCLRAAASTGLE